MANGIDWFRWHHGSVNDPKFGLVAKKAGARVGDVIAIWALVLEQASAATERGEYVELDCEATDFLLGADEGTTARIIEAMRARGLITGERVTRWEERQPKRERVDTTAADRKRAQRERQRDNHPEGEVDRDTAQSGCNGDVTPCHATSRHVTPREEESREEQKEPPKPPANPAGGSVRALRPKAESSTLRAFLETCKAGGERPIRDYSPLWQYAEEAKLPQDFVALAWVEFVRRFGPGGVKEAGRQKNWRQTFRNYVERNYLKLWAIDREGAYFLTADGKQAQKVHESKEAA